MIFDPIDITFRVHNSTVAELVESLKQNNFRYHENGPVDIHILEFLMLNIRVDDLIMHHINCSHYKVYRGSGLLRTLKYYVVDDNPMTGLDIFTELEGYSFSVIHPALQRRVRQSATCCYIDCSSYGTEDSEISEWYAKALESAY